MADKENCFEAPVSIFSTDSLSPMRSPDAKKRTALASIVNNSIAAGEMSGTQKHVSMTPKSAVKVVTQPRIEFAAHLDLLEFTSKPFLDFGTVRPGTTNTLFMNVRNPAILPQTCTVEKISDTDHFSCAPMTFTVGASSNFPLTFTWTPTEEGTFRTTAMLKWKARSFYIILYGVCSGMAKKRSKPADHNLVVEIYAAPHPATKTPRKADDTMDAPSIIHQAADEYEATIVESEPLEDFSFIPHQVDHSSQGPTFKARPLDRESSRAPEE
jgi:hypothetical protein